MPKLKLPDTTTPEKPLAISATFMDGDEFGGAFTCDLVQLGPGRSEGVVKGAMTARMAAVRFEFEPDATLCHDLPVGSLVFSVPIANGHLLTINGVRCDDSSIVLHCGLEGIVGRGERRRNFGGAVPMDRFLDDFAALTGQDRNAVAASAGRVALLPHEKVALCSALQAFIEAAHARPGPDDVPAIDSETWITHAVAVVAARAWWNRAPVEPPCCAALDVVGKAQLRFEDRSLADPTLADLCRAAGVSAPTLTNAFKDCLGLPPMRYFARKRLFRAKRELELGRYAQSAVKQAAFNNGFRQLGKFSGMYLAVFGELPSSTASRHCSSHWV